MHLPKTYVINVLLVFILFGISQTQSVYEERFTNQVIIVKYKSGEDYFYDKIGGDINIGYEDGSLGTSGISKEVYRTVLEFNISQIEEDARIDKAYLIISMSNYENGNYTMKIRQYTDDVNFQSNEDIWNTVNTGITYYGSVRYDVLDPLPNNNDLKESVRNALNGDKIVRIGVLSNEENTNRSGAYILDAELHIEYSKKISVTVENSFGKGEFKVDDKQYSNGKKFTDWYEGDEHKFENWDQTYDGVNYIFQNKWTNVTTGEVYNGNPASISFSEDATLRAEFKQKIHITVKNRHDGGQLKVDTETYNSGAEFDFWKNSTHDFESWEQTYGGFDMKFKDGVKWEMTEKTYNTALVQNHEVTTPGDYIAQLYQQYHYTADNDFLDGGSGGTIIINGETKSIPATGNTLEEDPFTVEAPQQTQTVNGRTITYNFIQWEDGSTNNPRSLNPDNHFDVLATYKGNMVSNASRATGYNNGRRIAKDGSGKLHLVYEDDGKIWYTSSTSNGYYWNKEEKIPIVFGPNHNPSIAITNGQPGEGIHVHVVWETSTIDQNNQEVRYISYSERSSNGWSSPIILSEGEFSPMGFWTGPDSRRPTIIGEGSDYLFVAWKSGNKIKIINHSNGTWSDVTTVPGAYDGYPVIGRTYSGTRKTKVIWSDDGDIRYIEGDYLGNNSWSWSGIKSLTSNFNSVICFNYEPTMDIASNGIGYVAWEAVSVSNWQRGVYFCKYDMYNNASQAWYLTKITEKSDEHFYPSINWDEANNRCTLAYQKTDHVYNLTNNYNSSTWSYADYGNGNYPNLPLEDNPVNIWTTYHSAPYLLKDYIMNSYLTKKAIAEEYKRLIYFNDQDSISLIIDLKNFSMDGKRLTFGQGLKTHPLTINGEVQFDYQIDLDSIKTEGNKKLMSFYFVADGQKYLLDQVELSPDEKDNVINRSVTFDPGKATEGHVQIEFPQATPFVINVVPDNASGLAKAASGGALQAFTPKSFRLNQNFPNPFNPTTQIVFDLPQESKVTLEVFDISGHKVATLAKGLKEAGRYHVVFDAHNLASGVYIYRLTTDKGFVQSKKMMLIR